jgi:hypothetical protein
VRHQHLEQQLHVIQQPHTSVKRLRSAVGSSFLPTSVGGFMAANSRKLGWITWAGRR